MGMAVSSSGRTQQGFIGSPAQPHPETPASATSRSAPGWTDKCALYYITWKNIILKTNGSRLSKVQAQREEIIEVSSLSLCSLGSASQMLIFCHRILSCPEAESCQCRPAHLASNHRGVKPHPLTNRTPPQNPVPPTQGWSAAEHRKGSPASLGHTSIQDAKGRGTK